MVYTNGMKVVANIDEFSFNISSCLALDERKSLGVFFMMLLFAHQYNEF